MKSLTHPLHSQGFFGHFNGRLPISFSLALSTKYSGIPSRSRDANGCFSMGQVVESFLYNNEIN